MAEIILSPEIEIRNDKDRELYWLFRQAVDSKFLADMNQHLADSDHCYSGCFNDYLDIRQLSLKQFIDNSHRDQHADEIIEQLVKSIGRELTDAISNMIAIYREAERRGIAIK